MTSEEKAEELASAIILRASVLDGTNLILAYADEIRGECERDKRTLAEKLRNYLPHCGKQDMTNGDRELVEWVENIMGKDY